MHNLFNFEACNGGATLETIAREHDPEKWKPVFRKDHAPPKVRAGCAIRSNVTEALCNELKGILCVAGVPSPARGLRTDHSEHPLSQAGSSLASAELHLAGVRSVPGLS